MNLDIINLFHRCGDGLALMSLQDSSELEGVKRLLEKNYVYIKENQKIYQTLKGMEVFSGYCDACECDPCDCDWGN